VAPAQASELPSHESGTIVIASLVAHTDVFPVTDVVANHAGHGTVMPGVVKAGDLLVCLPMGTRQG
jgi:UDP:flavonoid glycosyltransferase YjiC (YdhE family)